MYRHLDTHTYSGGLYTCEQQQRRHPSFQGSLSLSRPAPSIASAGASTDAAAAARHNWPPPPDDQTWNDIKAHFHFHFKKKERNNTHPSCALVFYLAARQSSKSVEFHIHYAIVVVK
jgi:hypothetical protein